MSIGRNISREPTRRYQKNLETMKKDAGVNAIENNIFKWDPQQYSSENSNTFWSTFQTRLNSWIQTSTGVKSQLTAFYSTHRMKLMDWNRKRAAKADLTRAVDSIIKTLKAVPDATPAQVQYCFYLGLCYCEKETQKLTIRIPCCIFFG